MLEAHPREKSIIVNYKLEAAVYGDGDVVDPMLKDKKVKCTTSHWIQQQNISISKACDSFLDIAQCHNNRGA